MTRRSWVGEAAPSLVLIAIAGFYAATALAYDPQSRAMPLGVALIAIALVILDLLSRGNGRLARNLRLGLQGSSARQPVPGLDGQAGQRQSALRALGAFAWIVGLLALVTVFGFYPAIPVYVTAYLWLYARKPLLASLATAAALTGLLFAMFEILLGYDVFGGLINGDFL